MNAPFKLFYFNARARAEIIRLLFVHAGVEYEDCRLTSEEFQSIKGDPSKFPLGQLPVLVVDGQRVIPQSHAIARHLARKFGLYGRNDDEALRIDVLYECVSDLYNQIFQITFFEKDETKQVERGNNFIYKDSVATLTRMCDTLKENSNGKGFFVGDTITLADIAVFNLTDVLSFDFPGLLDKYPILREFSGRMKTERKIAEWLAKRPKSSL